MPNAVSPTLPPMTTTYDAIVVGARCAGAPTAMLLARQGHRVLLVDRSTFPSDTLSTLVIQPHGVAALRRWGLLEKVAASGCPPIGRFTFDFGPVVVSGRPRPVDGSGFALAPRRSVLDKMLVDAAAEAGAEVREAFTVDELVFDDGAVIGIRGHADGGSEVVEHARVVIGADGHNSPVARAVDPPRYHEKPVLENAFYTFWQDLPVDGMITLIRGDRGIAAIPTNDNLTLVLVGCPFAQAAEFCRDVEANYFEASSGNRNGGTACRLRRARTVSPAAACPTSSASRMAPGGPSSATPGTRGTPSPPRASPTPSSTPNAPPRPQRHLVGGSHLRRGDGPPPSRAPRDRRADVRVHHAAGHPRAATARAAAVAGRHRRQPADHGALVSVTAGTKRHHRVRPGKRPESRTERSEPRPARQESSELSVRSFRALASSRVRQVGWVPPAARGEATARHGRQRGGRARKVPSPEAAGSIVMVLESAAAAKSEAQRVCRGQAVMVAALPDRLSADPIELRR